MITNIQTFVEQHSRTIVIVFFVLFLFLGLFIFDDFGISWDEYIQRYTGLVNFGQYRGYNTAIDTYPDRYYGPIFEVFLIFLEKTFNLSDDLRDVYLMRHMVTFLAFYAGVFAFYKISKGRFESRSLGLFGALMLILSPRIFGHAFYNTKDIVCMAMFIIAVFTLIQFLNKKTAGSLILHAITSAVLIDVRIIGIFVIGLTGLFYAADYFFDNKENRKLSEYILSFGSYLIIIFSIVIIFWPALWPNPFKHFVLAFNHFKQFPWGGNVTYLGETFKATHIPWHYVPVWISVTTPVIYTAGFLVGLTTVFWKLIKNPVEIYRKHKTDLICVIWIFMPLCSVIFLKSVLYDGWRQMFFIYPPLILLSLFGMCCIYEKFKSKLIVRNIDIGIATLGVIILLNMASVAQAMVTYHPYQAVYFNATARMLFDIRKTFEIEYWGISYRRALEFILEYDTAEQISLYSQNVPGETNSFIIPKKDRQRLVYLKHPEHAKYFITNFRGRTEDYPFGREIFHIKLDGSKIVAVYQLR